MHCITKWTYGDCCYCFHVHPLPFYSPPQLRVSLRYVNCKQQSVVSGVSTVVRASANAKTTRSLTFNGRLPLVYTVGLEDLELCTPTGASVRQRVNWTAAVIKSLQFIAETLWMTLNEVVIGHFSSKHLLFAVFQMWYFDAFLCIFCILLGFELLQYFIKRLLVCNIGTDTFKIILSRCSPIQKNKDLLGFVDWKMLLRTKGDTSLFLTVYWPSD